MEFPYLIGAQAVLGNRRLFPKELCKGIGASSAHRRRKKIKDQAGVSSQDRQENHCIFGLKQACICIRSIALFYSIKF